MAITQVARFGTSIRFTEADGDEFFIEGNTFISIQAVGNRVYIDYNGPGSVILEYDLITSPVTASPQELAESIQGFVDQTLELGGLANRVVVTDASQLSGVLDSTKQYFIDGAIDMGTQSIEVPASGLSLRGYGFDLSSLFSSEAGFSLFTSPVGGSGNLLIEGLAITTSGAGSQVYDLTDSNGTHAIEVGVVNYSGCTSLGEITNYRQGLEVNTGRFGGTPELTLSGSWGGFRISTSIVRGISDITALFKTGTGLSFSSRFITDINCDLPAVGALIDFSSANFTEDRSLILKGCFITRQGNTDASDTTIYPNIDNVDVKSAWSDNTGLPNTIRYIKGSVTAEVQTVINTVSTREVLLGTFAVMDDSQLDMPANGEFRALTGQATYLITGNLTIDGSPNRLCQVSVTRSIDGGATFPEVVGTVTRSINSLQGGRDVAFLPLEFIVDLNENDRVRLEVQNNTDTTNFTLENDSYIIVKEA